MSKSIRMFGSSMGIFTGVMCTGVSMYTPSAALESATGLSVAVSIPVMAVVSVVYTALGGMRAVIWTDVFQFLIMVGGMVAIIVKGLILVGGIGNVFRLAEEEGRLVFANFSFDPRERNTFWSLTIGLTFSWIHMFGLAQPSVQRFSAVDKLSKARATILFNIAVYTITFSMCSIIGLIVLAYYASIKCDPLANKDTANPNMLLPYFVITNFADSPGFSGLFLSALYGGELSTISSMLSGSAANVWEDILKWKLNHLPETRKVFINRLLVVLLGTLSTGVAFLFVSAPGPITQAAMAMVSSFTGPLMAIFFLGAVSKHANWKGTILGGLAGVLIIFWLNIGSLRVRNIHPPLPPVSTEQCSLGNGNSTLFPSSLNYTNYTSFEIVEGIDLGNNWTRIDDTHTQSTIQVSTQLRGLDNFYAISYLWFTLFGAIITGTIGMIASLIMRDRDLEAKVDERLLMRFRWCGWSDKSVNREQLNDKDCSGPQETKELNGPEDEFLLRTRM